MGKALSSSTPEIKEFAWRNIGRAMILTAYRKDVV